MGRKRTLPTHDEMVANILSVAARGTDADVEAGAEWYAEAYAFCATLAAGTPYAPSAMAGIVAVLSPQCPWAMNKRWAMECLEAMARGDSAPPAVSTTKNRAKAWRILHGESPATVVKGPKVEKFYANIMGDESAVTVDVWAWYVATGEKLTKNQSVPEWAFPPVTEAYRDAARILGTTPRKAQARTWGIARAAFE